MPHLNGWEGKNIKKKIKYMVCNILFFIVLLGSIAIATIITILIFYFFTFLPRNGCVMKIVFGIVWFVVYAPLYLMLQNLSIRWLGYKR